MASVWDAYQAQGKRTSSTGAGGSGALDKWVALPASDTQVWKSSPAKNPEAEDDQRLKGETTRADRIATAYEAAGEEAPGGETSLLEGIGSILDRGRAAVTGGVSGTMYMVGSTLEQAGVSNVLDEWSAETWNGKEGQDAQPDSFGDAMANTPWARALRGLTGREKYGAGDFNGPLKFQDDDSTLERIAKGAGTFATEVALDPTTYLTFGAGAVGKQAASGGLKLAARAAAKDITEDAALTLAGKDATYTALRASLEKGQADNVWKALSDRTGRSVEDLQAQYADAAEALGANARTFATDQLENELATGYLSRGGRGLREAINSNNLLSPAQKTALWESLSPELRGGVRLTVPFTGKTSKAALVGSVDDPLLDKFGLGRAADTLYGLRGTVSTSAPMRAVRSKISGRTGSVWNNVLTQAYDAALRDGDDTARYTDWRQLDEALRSNRGVEADLSRTSVRTMQAIVTPLRTLPKEERDTAKEAFYRFVHNADEVPAENASAADVAGYAASQMLRAAMDDKFTTFRDAGGDIGEIADYMARQITDEARAARAKSKRGNVSRTANPSAAREAFKELTGVDDDGNLIVKWTDIPTINAKYEATHGYKLFEDDPLKIVSAYMAAMDSRIASIDLVNSLKRAGLAVSTGTATRKMLNENKVAKVVKEAQESAARTGTVNLDNVLQGDVATFLNRTADWPYEERQQAVDALMKAARTVFRVERDQATGTAQTSPAKAAKTLAKVERNLARATVNAVYKEKEVTSELAEGLADRGYSVLGSPRANGSVQPLSVPAQLGEDTYVNEVARSALEAHYAARTPDSVAQHMYDAVSPLMRVFVAWATVGRGGGYHARNAIGAMWNNLLMGVTRKQYVNSGKIMLARRDAAAAARALPEGSPADVIQATYDDVMMKALEPKLYGAWKSMDEQGLFTSTMRSQLLGQDMPGDIGLSYLDETNAIKQPRVMKNLRFEKYTPVDATPNKAPADKSTFDRALNRSVNNAWIQFSGDIGQITEEYFRTAAFLKGAQMHGLGDGGAAAYTLVRASQFDYGDLSDFEQKYMKLIFPFWVWTRNNVPLQVRALVSDPKYASTLGKFQSTLEEMFADDSEAGQQFDRYKPDWLTSKMSFVTPLNFGGGPITLGVESPVTDLNKLGAWSANPADWWDKLSTEGLGMASPVVKMPMEAATGVDTFTGSAIPEYVDAPNWAKATANVPILNRFLAANIAGEDNPQMNGVLANFLKDSVPPLGMVENLVPFGQPQRNADRWATSMASTALGMPVATLTQDQMRWALVDENSKNEDNLKRIIGARYPNADWDQFMELVRGGAQPEFLQQWLDSTNA